MGRGPEKTLLDIITGRNIGKHHPMVAFKHPGPNKTCELLFQKSASNL